MALTRSELVSRIRNRVRDTKTPYHFSDSLLQELLNSGIGDMAIEIRSVDPDYYLTRRIYTAQTDALDPGTYEYYPLPEDMAELRWIERADGHYHPKIWQHTTGSQEQARYPILYGTLTIPSGDVFSVPRYGSAETVSIHGDRFRVVPAPTSTTPRYGVYYDRRAVEPSGDDELVDIPAEFEVPLLLSVAISALRLDGDPLAEVLATELHGNVREEGRLRKAKRSFGRRKKKPVCYLSPDSGSYSEV